MDYNRFWWCAIILYIKWQSTNDNEEMENLWKWKLIELMLKHKEIK